MIQGYTILMAFMLPAMLIIYTTLSLFIQKRADKVFIFFGFFIAWVLSAVIAVFLSQDTTFIAAEKEVYLASFIGSIVIILSLAFFGKKKKIDDKPEENKD